MIVGSKYYVGHQHNLCPIMVMVTIYSMKYLYHN